MSVRELEDIVYHTKEIADDLYMIDFDTPPEPDDDAGLIEWRDFAYAIADKIAEAEKVVKKAVNRLEG